ncbi:MAG: gliding motility-associated C-terminal domain-containing protein [bacterium]|nr:gliding motility-associated C-terminal domain-containing protein [bacterium]
MNRVFKYCFLVLSVFIFGKVSSQTFNFSVNPQTQCYNASNIYTANVGLFIQFPGATDYTWTIQSPTGTCVPTFSLGQHGALNPTNTGSQIAITFPCCGVFTITGYAFNNTVNPGTPILIGSPSAQQATVFCQSSGSVVTTPSILCIGQQAFYTGSGGAVATSYTWDTGFNGNPLVLTPTIGECHTFTATTANGCTISPAAACVSVQAVSMTVSPTTQTICANSPICLTATANAVTNSSVTAGTLTTGIQWYAPGGLAVPGCTTGALAGTYTAVVTHTGAAGVCTFSAPSVVVTSTNISVSISASAPSVCPGASVQLTAASVQTAATSYTWTRSTGGFPVVGNPVTYNPFSTTNYTVTVDYFNCPGTATISVGMLTISPTLTPSSFSICPGSSFTLSASGGSLYTFRYLNPAGFPTSTVIGTSNSTVVTRVHTPTVTPNTFPALYSVSSTSNGCSGSSTITVFTRTLYPTLVNSSPSVCPGTEFTLTANGAGAGTNYTFVAPYTPSLIGTPNPSVNFAIHTPPSPIPHTYTVLADSSGCKGSAQVTVNLMPLTPTLVPSSYSICPGTALNFTATGGAGSTYTFVGPATPGPSSVIASGTANIITFTATTTPPLAHTYTVLVDSAGCKGTNTVVIGVLNLGPLLNITASSPSICLGTSVDFTAAAVAGPGNYNYVFVAPGPTTLALTSPNTATDIPLSLPGTYTVYADSSSCAGSNTITIFEKILNPIIVASNTLVCKGTAVTLSATNVGYGPMTTYLFGTLSPTFAPIIGGGPTFSTVVQNPTFQTVYTVIVDSAGCKGSILSPPTVTVFMRPDITLTPIASSASVCPGTAATISVSGPTTNLAPISYTWTQATGSGSLYPTPSPTSALALAYPVINSTYSISALDTLGCIGSTVIAVGVDPLISFPVSLGSSGSTICAGQSVTLSTTYTINTVGIMTYTWSPLTGVLTSVNSISVAVSPSVTSVYSVIVSNLYGCMSGGTINVPVGQYPILSAPPSAAAVCAGFTSTITAFGANSYTWTGTTFTNSVPQQSISVGPGCYKVIGSNGGGCIDSLSICINTLAPLNIQVSQSSPTTCIESNTPKFSKAVKLSASGAATYVWFPYNPNNMTYSLGPTTDVRPPTSTCYTVIGSTAICAGQTVVCLNVIPQFSMNVIPPLPAMCLGDSLKLSIVNISTLAVGPVSKFTYSWTEAANAPPISISNNLTPTVVVFPQNTTTYSVEVRDSRQCISLPRLVTVTVFPKPITAIAIPTINSVATNTVCYVGLNPGAQDVTINLIAANMNTGLQFGVVPTYTWMSPYKTKYNSILTPSNSAAVTVNAPLKLPSVVIYTVISGYNGIPGCKRMDTVSVRVVDCRPVRDVKFTTIEDNDTICARNCITFMNLTDTMAGGPQKLVWQFPGGSPSTSTVNIPTVCYNLPGKFNVILGVANPYPISSGGSSLTIGQLNYVKVVDVPNVTIIPPGQSRSDTTVRFGQSVSLKGTGALTYEWSPRYNITSLTNPNVTVNPFKTTQYILTGYNSKRCASSDTINVIIIDECGEMYVPNAFTPNGDGANDVLYVRGICMQSLTFMVFNRWGEKVFETNDQKNGWDGTYKGVEMNTGVFVYRLEGKTYDGKGFSLKGNVTLIR